MIYMGEVTKWEDKKTYRCPCCHYKTLHSRGRHELCPVCRWEDDGQDEYNAEDVRGGPNALLSLRQAQKNFLEIGAKHAPSLRNARAPRAEEMVD